jgi:hypothetical protein
VGKFFCNGYVEFALLFLSIGAGAYIIYDGFVQHRKNAIIGCYVLGILCWSLHLVCEFRGIAWIGLEYVLFVGSFWVLLSYYLNHRFTHCMVSSSCDR